VYLKSVAKDRGNAEQIAELLSSKLESAMAKMMMTIPMVIFFGMLYFSLNKCKPATSFCSNQAIPICVSTGLPPITQTCPMQCTPGTVLSSVICPDENIPGAKVENQGQAKLGSYWTTADRIVSYAPTTGPGRCEGEGGLGYLCSDKDVYLYSLPSTGLNIQDTLARSDVAVSPYQVIVAEYGDLACADPKHVYSAHVGVSSNVSVVISPPHNIGQSVFALCYKASATAQWAPVHTQKGGQVYVIVGPEAGCRMDSCGTSDFTNTMRSSSNFVDSMYFAMVVHSTVGFGDISPLSQRGMILVAMHALVVLLVSYF
jgi:hypothetical protein